MMLSEQDKKSIRREQKMYEKEIKDWNKKNVIEKHREQYGW